MQKKTQVQISVQGALMGLLHYCGEPTLGKQEENKDEHRL